MNIYPSYVTIKKLANLLICIILITFSGNLFSQEDITIYSTDNVPIIDGIIEGLWNDYPSQSLENILTGTILSDADFSAEFRVIWNSSSLFVLVDITDDTKVFDSEDIVWQDDAIEIYLDINNDKLSSYGENDYQYSFRHNDATIHTNANTAGIVFAEGSKTGGYIMEIQIPWATLGLLSAESGQLHGFDIHVHDDDDGGDRDAKLAWYTTVDESYLNPSLFATAILHGTFVQVYRAERPLFSKSHGFYTEPFDLTITSAIPGAEIYYTLDGSDPRYSSTSTISSSPTILRIDPTSATNRGQTPAVVVRASVIKEGYDFSKIETQTYIFINQVRNQTDNPGHDWPTTNINGQEISYHVSQDVINDDRYTDLLDEALTEIPSFSIVTDNRNLWDANKGIYVNALEHGAAWERPASIELINPDGSDGFQIDAGIRIRGGYSRNDFFPKHAFRLFFRNQYGTGKLNYPLFDDEGVKSFDKIDLRCSQNYAWSRPGDNNELNTLNREVFSRDLQFSIGQPSTRSKYYHLYVNGMYWGVFQTQERSEARYAASYFGGNASDYDVVKRGDGGIEATDGTLDAWEDIWSFCQEGFVDNDNYYEVQGLNADGSRDTLLPVLLDIDNLIDYMLIIFYTGNFDAPVSKFMSNTGPNNFYAIYNRNGKTGFRFWAHDAEHTLITRTTWIADGIEENRVNIGESTEGDLMTCDNFSSFHPQWLHFKLSDNVEYASRFADRAYKYLYNNGAMTPDKLSELFISRTYQYDTAIIAESMRWGDFDISPSRTKDDDWVPIVNEIMDEWFPARTNILIQQLKDVDLLPAIDAPEYSNNGNTISESELEVESGYSLRISNPNQNGTIYYTTDGTDPKGSAGVVGNTAINGTNQANITISKTTIIKSRIKYGSVWSPLHEISVINDEDLSGLQLTEIHYHPLNFNDLDDSELEFIELKNTCNSDINLTKVSFTNGIIYTFNKEKVLAPDEFVVIASNAIAFVNRYGFSAYDQYEGQLENAGEKITLLDPTGDTIFSVRYNDKSPWPKSPDGAGFSLVPLNNDINADWNLAENWRPSSAVGGSPGEDDPFIDIPIIYITEILTNSDMPETDAIELYNPNNTEVDVGGWFLTDNRGKSQKWQIPFNSIIPANGYKVFYEGHYEGDILTYANYEFGSSFSLNSFGDEIYLFSGNSQGDITGYEFGFDFAAFETGVSVGKYVISTGDIHYVAQKSQSLESENSGPKVGPIVFNMINYHPQINDFEYLVLLNISNNKVNLFDEESKVPWEVGGLNFDFPDSFSLDAGETVYLIESSILPADFRSLYNLSVNQKILNYPGNMDNNGERLSLRKALTPFYDDTLYIEPYVLIDRVKYNDNDIWPDADGNGYSLVRKNIAGYGNDPDNWIATPPSLSITTFALTAGVQGIPYNQQLNVINGNAPYTWSIEGTLPTGLELDSTKGIIFGTPDTIGEYPLTLQVVDQQAKSDEIITNLIIAANTAPVAINDSLSIYSNINGTTAVLLNDEDNDNDKEYWNIIIITGPANGTSYINNDNSITYIPNDNYTGLDQLTYEVSDIGGSSQAVLFIEVLEQVNTFEISVLGSEDDGEEEIGSGSVNITSTDLELVNDPNLTNGQIIGIRFQSISILQGAVINSAYIQFQTDEVSSDVTSLNIKGEAVDSAFNFVDGNIPSIRNKTTASVNWNPEAWNVEGERTEIQKTTDISTIVQEIINRVGWKYGNAMAFIIDGTGYRVAESFDGDQNGAAKLIIEYRSQPSDAIAPIADAGKDQLIDNGNLVKLDGTNSYSLDGSLINYNWIIDQKPLGSEATLSNVYSSNPSFTCDKSGLYRIILYVDNGLINSNTDTVYITASNTIPFAIAGLDQNSKTNTKIFLNGSLSYDQNGDSISYLWNFESRPSGSTASISSISAVNPWFIPDVSGTYEISLIVNDDISNSQVDYVTITIIDNSIPVAIAGEDIVTIVDKIVYLFAGDSYDNDLDGLTYRWKLVSKPLGSLTLISDTTILNPTITPDSEGDYIISLVVNDGLINSSSDIITITANLNLAPIANAGPNQETEIGNVIRLNGLDSYDPDGSYIEYFWSIISQPSGSDIDIMGVNLSNPSITPVIRGIYTFSLIVFDGSSYSSADEVTITVNNNLTPIANAGENMEIKVNEIINLDASGSYDPEGINLTYKWSVISKPARGIYYISDAAVIKPGFTAGDAGSYDLQLIVNDGFQDSKPDVVTITVVSSNSIENIFTDITSIQVYPNPFKDWLNIKFEVIDQQDVTVQIINFSGTVVYNSKIENLDRGVQTLNLETNSLNLSDGLYLILIKSGSGETNTIKVNYSSK